MTFYAGAHRDEEISVTVTPLAGSRRDLVHRMRRNGGLECSPAMARSKHDLQDAMVVEQRPRWGLVGYAVCPTLDISGKGNG